MKKVRDINIKNTIANWIITRNYSLDRYAVQSCVNCIDPYVQFEHTLLRNFIKCNRMDEKKVGKLKKKLFPL